MCYWSLSSPGSCALNDAQYFHVTPVERFDLHGEMELLLKDVTATKDIW